MVIYGANPAKDHAQRGNGARGSVWAQQTPSADWGLLNSIPSSGSPHDSFCPPPGGVSPERVMRGHLGGVRAPAPLHAKVWRNAHSELAYDLAYGNTQV